VRTVPRNTEVGSGHQPLAVGRATGWPGCRSVIVACALPATGNNFRYPFSHLHRGREDRQYKTYLGVRYGIRRWHSLTVCGAIYVFGIYHILLHILDFLCPLLPTRFHPTPGQFLPYYPSFLLHNCGPTSHPSISSTSQNVLSKHFSFFYWRTLHLFSFQDLFRFLIIRFLRSFVPF